MKRYTFLSTLLLIIILFSPINAHCQSRGENNILIPSGVNVQLRIDKEYDFETTTIGEPLEGTVVNDLYYSDGKTILIKAGTRAIINYSLQRNGRWGKGGSVVFTNATIRTVDNKSIALILNNSNVEGHSYRGPIFIISIVHFPIGLLSGLIKGDMPTVKEGTIINAYTIADSYVDIPFTEPDIQLKTENQE